MRTADGFVTTMHERVRESARRHRVPFFNPGSNASQVSRRRLINPTEAEVAVTHLALDAYHQALYHHVMDPHDALKRHGSRASQSLSVRYTKRSPEAGLQQSVASVTDSSEAFAESIIGLPSSIIFLLTFPASTLLCIL